MSRTKHLLQSSLIVMLLFAVNKVTGFVRLQLTSAEFGTSPQMDAFTAANQLPEVFYVLIAGGALAAAFVPVYTQYLKNDNSDLVRQSGELANTVFTLVLMVLTVICGLAAIFAPWITRVVLVPDFSPEQQLLTAQIMRIILINTGLFGISGILTSLLHSHQHFLLPAAAPIALDIGYMIGLFLFVPSMGIFGLAWGTVVAALLHIGVQVPALIKHRIRIRPKLNFKIAGVREIIWLMGPRIVMLGAIQIADIFIVRLGSSLPEGSVSGYFYAWTLMQLPETLFGTAIGLVIFPTMSELYNSGDLDGLKKTAMSTLRIVWLFTIPSAVGLIMLGEPLVALILQRGSFDADSTALVNRALMFLSVRVVSEASLEIVARLFYARHNTFVPMLAYLVWLVVNVAATFALIGSMGIAGMALASTIAFTVLAILLFILNQRELGGLIDRALVMGLGRAMLAAGGMAVVIWGISALITSPLVFLAAAASIGGVVYFAIYWLLGGDEIKALISLIQNRRVGLATGD